MNMLIYDIVEDRVFDVCGSSVNDIEHKVIRTFFDPDFICSQNPLVILRALKYSIKYAIFVVIAIKIIK
jgi:tRNA nucleotidyltransferase/poly(A) polymerase